MSELSAKELKDRFKKKLESSGLSDREAKKLGFELLAATAMKDEGFDKVAGFKIPYFDLNGKQTKFFRVRYLESTKRGVMAQTDKKEIKYKQLPDTVNELYIPPLMDWNKFAESNAPLIITEGELKAAAATHRGFPTVGLGGVWMFRSGKNGVTFLPQLEKLVEVERPVFIIFDSDAATNANVVAAENALSIELMNRGITAHIIRLPNVLPNGKTGLDDYLLEKEDAEFEELITTTAEPFRLSKELHLLNEKVMLVRNPAMVYERRTGFKYSVNDFKNVLYADRFFEREYKLKSGEMRKEKVFTATEWVKWPGRSVVDQLVYEPGEEEIVNGCLNTWRGWPFEPKKGSIRPWNDLLDYVFAGNDEARRWFEQWCAFPLQNPGTKLYSAVVIWGAYQGTGKTLIGYTLKRLYGENAIEIGNEDLQSTDNDYAENKQFVVGEEITGGDKRGIADRLKSLVTRDEVRVNIKYVAKYSIRDCINYYFTSNHPDAFYLDKNDRRFFIHEIQSPPKDKSFYKEYDHWFKSQEGMEALFHHLLSVDVSNFDPLAAAPESASKLEMIDLGRSDVDAWVHMLHLDPDSALRIGDHKLPFSLYRAEDLLAAYNNRVGGDSKLTAGGLARALTRAGFRKPCPYGCRSKTGQLQLWAIRDPGQFAGWSGTQLGEHYDKERELKGKKYAA